MDEDMDQDEIINDLTPSHVKYWLNSNHDCFFVVGTKGGPTERIGAIKVLLMGHSEPLRAMLGESKLAEKGDVHLTDVQPQTFKHFLNCVYGNDNIIDELNFEESVNLLYLTEKYLVDYFKSDLISHIAQLLSPNLIFQALSHPACFQDKELQSVTLKYLLQDICNILKDKQFLDINNLALLWILQQENLNVSEVTLWNAVVNWAKHQGRFTPGKALRPFITSHLKFIRFLTFGCADFCTYVVPTNILLQKEVYGICRSMGTGEPVNLRHISNCTTPRYKSSIDVDYTCLTADYKYDFVFNSRTKNCALSFVINDIYNLKSSYSTDSVTFCGFKWKMTLQKKENLLVLLLDWKNVVQHPKCLVTGSLIIENQNGKREPLRTKYSDLKCFESYGYWKLNSYDWNLVVNSDSGFVKNDSLFLLAFLEIKHCAEG